MRVEARFLVLLLFISGVFYGCLGSGPPSKSGGGGSTQAAGGAKKRAEVVTTAKKYLGTPYKFGGSDPSGFDCSGFVLYCVRQSGVTLPREAADQFSSLRTIKTPEPGDLVYFHTYGTGVSHVGIYTGKDTFIHSPTSGRTVEYADMRIDYWRDAYRGARRVFW